MEWYIVLTIILLCILCVILGIILAFMLSQQNCTLSLQRTRRSKIGQEQETKPTSRWSRLFRKSSPPPAVTDVTKAEISFRTGDTEKHPPPVVPFDESSTNLLTETSSAAAEREEEERQKIRIEREKQRKKARELRENMRKKYASS